MENRRNCKKWMNDFLGGVLLISRDEEEKILAVNEEVLRIFECPGEKEFMNLSGSRFRGLMPEEEYHSLEEIFSSHNEKGRYNFYNFSSISLRGRTLDVEGLLGRAEDDALGPVWVLGLVRSEARHRALEQEMDIGLIGKYDFRREAFRLKQEDMAQGVYGKRIVIFINLVRFSFINANYGVGVGNAVLEKMNLIHLLDSYVIEETAKLYVKLMREGWPVVPVSVNLSRMDFDAMDPFAFLEHIVSTYQVPRRLFRIEVTESALTLNGRAMKEVLSRFHEAGYQLWLDDFGSGYSSLNVLKEFHFDELKIDMAFLRNFNEKSREIIRSIILMAKNLSIHTLAEGAETKEQVEFLKESGCEKIQGFFYGRPMSWEEAREKSPPLPMCRKRRWKKR